MTTETTTEQTQSLENKPVETQTPPAETQAPIAFKTFQTEEDFNNETAKIRGTAERKARSELLKQLGIDSEDKLDAIKTAYQNSLTEQDRIAEQLKQLDTLKAELAENKAIITALSKMSNKPADEVSKLVKMAKGLVSEDCTIEQALEEVMKMVQVQPTEPQKPTIPVSQPMTVGSTAPIVENPFKDGNLTKITQLIAENPDEARKLAKIANYKITW